MARSWFFGGLVGFAVCMTVAALPSIRRGDNASGAPAAAPAPVVAASAASPHYRVPTGSPISNPPTLPGHIRPYAAAGHAPTRIGRYSGAATR